MRPCPLLTPPLTLHTQQTTQHNTNTTTTIKGVSGLNRHARQEDVLGDAKNRLVTTYLHLVALLTPDFILMEQVCEGARVVRVRV